MREEAAKAAAGAKRAITSDYSDGWADACERIERAIRAIPEKQSMAEVDPNAWAFKNGLESP